MSRPARRPRSVKVGDDLWTAAMRKADERGEVLSEVIREALKRYVSKGGRHDCISVRNDQL